MNGWVGAPTSGLAYLWNGFCNWLGWVYCNDDAVDLNLDGGLAPPWSLWEEVGGWPMETSRQRGSSTLSTIRLAEELDCCFLGQGQQWSLGSISC
jgi:hypothetical protein